jgi:DNA-binding response OmpR family regulator
VRLLLLEDDYRLRQAMGRRLRSDGHAVDEATTLEQARTAIADTGYDCLIMDRLVPDGDALEIAAEIGTDPFRPPILMLSGLGEHHHRVDGLVSGADDYLAKPVDLEEMALRVRKLIARRTSTGSRLQLGRVEVNRSRREVTIDGVEVHLSPTQYAVFEQLVINVDRVVDQGALLESCWDAHRDPFSNPLHSQINRLRSTFRGLLTITSVRGSGYLLRVVSKDN